MTVTANTDNTKAAAPKRSKAKTAEGSTEVKTEGTQAQTPQNTEDENLKVNEQTAGDEVQTTNTDDENNSGNTPNQNAQNTEDENQKVTEQLGGDGSEGQTQVPDQQSQDVEIKPDVAPKNDESEALGPLELAVLNNGANTHCNVTRTNLPRNERVVVKYKTPGAKKQAQMNFAQLNALAGKERFVVEG
ncbi:hypothetical protein QDS01_17910 [Acinetobacter nosocomialis]|uniref:hypothetical protein n=1 Tax=Acinetobacter nosocomialis TaxID=106654 RepID=UPI0024477F91|nr:hypothetical protein [Acinetobacter nosocomialis]MDH2636787.1 hypothetical protein [Acinetobacter nosocomialis]